MFEITLLNIQLLHEDGFILNTHFYTIKGNMFSPDKRKRYRKCFLALGELNGLTIVKRCPDSVFIQIFIVGFKIDFFTRF